MSVVNIEELRKANEQRRVKFVHLRDHDGTRVRPNGGCTIAYMIESNLDGRLVHFAVAECHTIDNFCKATGRQKAAARLDSHRLSTYLPYTGEHNSEVVELIKRAYYRQKEEFELSDGDRPWKYISRFRY